VELVKEIHRILTAGIYDEQRFVEKGERPGEFKKHDYIAGIHEVGSLPEQVESDLRELLEEISGDCMPDTLKAAAYFHARFEYIHPFADGNGRVGRTLLNYYLLIHNEPPLIIFDEDKARYYRALESYDADDEISLMHEFLIDETEKTWKGALDRSQGVLPKEKRKLNTTL
jgi:Fic family protein